MNIEFATKEAEDLFCDMCIATHGLKEKSLGSCVRSLMQWRSPRTGIATIRIGLDFAPKSFSFQEVWPDGSLKVNGGIVFHRNYVKAEDGTMAPSGDPYDGYYEIHT